MGHKGLVAQMVAQWQTMLIVPLCGCMFKLLNWKVTGSVEEER